MLGGESSNYFFQTPRGENPYQLDSKAPFQLKQHGTGFDVNSSQQPDNSDVSSLSLNPYWSDRLDLNLDLNLHPAGVSTSLSLCLPEDRHGFRAETSSVYNDLRAEITRQEDDLNAFIRKKEEEMCRELLKISEQQVINLANSMERHYEQKIFQKNLELEAIYAKNRDLMEKANLAAAQARHWQFQAWESEVTVGSLQAELGRAREVPGKHDAASGVYGECEDDADVATRCRICKREGATILHLPCCHLSVCAGCDQTTEVCPICLSPKTQSIEVIFP